MTSFLVQGTLALLPVPAFLLALVWMDSYQLVRTRTVLTALLVGCLAALAARELNQLLLDLAGWSPSVYSLYIAPIIEEALKGAWVVFLVARRRVGFLVDGAILGFAIGAGFAITENLYFLKALPDAHLFVWMIRGFGTAAMHGSATALLALVLQGRCERSTGFRAIFILPGFALAVLVHSVFNHFFISPLMSAAGIVLGLPLLMVLVFRMSDNSVSRWLGSGFDTDAELLKLIDSGQVSHSPIGEYLIALNRRFPPIVVADMFCLLRITVELSIEAKGLMLMRKHGFETPPSAEAKEKLEELVYLEKSIGATGRLAVRPLIPRERRDLWQLQLLQ